MVARETGDPPRLDEASRCGFSSRLDRSFAGSRTRRHDRRTLYNASRGTLILPAGRTTGTTITVEYATAGGPLNSTALILPADDRHGAGAR